ncbi:MAG TPA: hypothetical protein V6C65_12230 [Allocoleopsis sp.]
MMIENKELRVDILPDDWFDRGKMDAWAGRSKRPPEHDPQAASFYDLGYGEGTIQRSPH